jgi:galactokinase
VAPGADPASVEIAAVDSRVSHPARGANTTSAARNASAPPRRSASSGCATSAARKLGRIARLTDPLGRRARHVVTENARALAAVEALENDDPRRSAP